MSTLLHVVQVPALILLNIVIGLLVVRGIVNLVSRLMEDEPGFVFVALPVAVLVTTVSLAIWTIAMAS